MPPKVLPHLIDGVHRPSETGKTLPIARPLTGVVDQEISRGGPVEANLAVKGARTAGALWRGTPAHERAKVLLSISEKLLSAKDTLSRRIAVDVGKPIRDARIEVERAASVFTFAAEALRRPLGETYPADAYPLPPGNEHRMLFSVREPLGVIVAISPFNFPLNLLAHKVAPALAAGNTVVAKPASLGSAIGLALGDIALESGLPAGAFNVVLGSGSEVGMSLASHPAVRMVILTGSVETGRKVAERAGAGGKKVLLEMGGMDALVIFEDAPLGSAVEAAVRGAFGYSGQVCTATKRILVHAAVASQFLDQFVARVQGLRVGDPTEETTDVGPLIETAAVERVAAMVNDALEKGAKVRTGGSRTRVEVGPNFFAPTVLTEVPDDARVVQEEPFGPVVPVLTFSDEAEALERANSTRYGLQAAVYTQDLARALRMARDLQVGGVHINDPTTLRWDALPFGGVRASGIGREGVDRAIEAMSEVKLVSVNIA